MKKEVLLVLLISFLIFIPFVFAQDETVGDNGYTCLADKVNTTGCNRLSTQGKIFALLSLGECFGEVLNDSNYMKDLKLTSQAIFALENLNNVDVNTTEGLDWILSKNKTPTDFTWYLQIDSSQETTCTITYDDTDYSVGIGEDKKLDSDAGTCLTRASGDYWLEIDPSCYSKEFYVSCGESTDSLTFLTNLLFKTPGSDTIHVSSESHTDNGGGATSEQISIACFGAGSSCDYEGTLWAVYVLNSEEFDYSIEELSPYLFYLSSLYKENPTYLPESILYSLKGDSEYKNSLLSKQTSEGFWKVGSDKFYDTALALISLPTSSTQYTKAVTWLEKNQDSSGCWNKENPTDTGFILNTVWPIGVGLNSNVIEDTQSEDETIIEDVDQNETDSASCENQGYFCMSGINCQGTILSDYSCSGFDKCCSKEEVVETCDTLNGDVCNSNQKCASGTSEKTFELDYGQTCCIGGSCETVEDEGDSSLTCVSNGGTCRFNGCLDSEEENSDTCEFGYTCCTQSSSTSSSSLWIWILVLIVLLALVSVGIIKRDKLREFWFRIKSNFKKSPPSQGVVVPGRMPNTPAAAQRRMMQGRPYTPMGRPQARSRPSGNVNDVLKKLKNMSS